MPLSDLEVSILLPSQRDALDEVRAELSELVADNALEPLHISWAIEQLVESGVELPLVMATVFDFAPVEWLGKRQPQEPSGFDFDHLASLLGIDPKTGKPITAAPPLRTRTVQSDLPPSSRVGKRTTSATTLGSEGMRQRPLDGWSRRR